MKAKKVNNPKRDFFNYIGIIAIIFLLNFILSFFFGRYDLTEDKRHSLSDNTIALLSDENRIEERIFFKIYLAGDLPADMMKIRNSLQEILDEFIVYSGDKIQYEFIDPNGEDDPVYNYEVQKNIFTEGIVPCDMHIVNSGKEELLTLWPGALIEYKGKTVDQIQFFNTKLINSNTDTRGLADKTITNLEYQLISAIRRVSSKNKKTVAFLQGQDELDEWQTADVRSGLDRYYFVEDVEIAGQLEALKQVDALIIAQPKKAFTEKDKFIIDQFIMHGGKVLWFIDPISVNRDSLLYKGETLGLSANLNIEKDMIYKYGARLNSNIILDKECGPNFIPGHPLEVVNNWYFYPTLQRADHSITKNIDPIKSEYASTIDIVNKGDLDVKKTVLLHSSYNSQAYKSPVRVHYGIINIEPNFNKDEEETNFPIAVMLEGKFTSAFENTISDAFLKSTEFKTKFKSDSTKMLVVSDGDIIRNEVRPINANGEVKYETFPLRSDVYGMPNPNNSPKYTYGNKDFILNCIDYMLDDFSLIDVRAKTITMRVLDEEKIANEKGFWKFINIGIPLIIILLLALSQFLIRRKKYTSKQHTNFEKSIINSKQNLEK